MLVHFSAPLVSRKHLSRGQLQQLSRFSASSRQTSSHLRPKRIMASALSSFHRMSCQASSFSALQRNPRAPSNLQNSACTTHRHITYCRGSDSFLDSSSFLGGKISVCWARNQQQQRPGQAHKLHRVAVRAAGGGAGREPWDFSRFLKTVLYFNEPPKLEEVSSRRQSKVACWF
jgi:hypothetical protein